MGADAEIAAERAVVDAVRANPGAFLSEGEADVLDTIRSLGEVSVLQIAEDTGRGRTRCWHAVTALLGLGLVERRFRGKVALYRITGTPVEPHPITVPPVGREVIAYLRKRPWSSRGEIAAGTGRRTAWVYRVVDHLCAAGVLVRRARAAVPGAGPHPPVAEYAVPGA